VEFEFLVNDVLQKISLEKKDKHYYFSDHNNTYTADIRYISPNQISILVDGRSYLVYFAQDKDNRYFLIGGQHFIVTEPSEEGGESFRRGEEITSEGTLLVKAPMPGKVIKVNVAEKEKVRKNQTLAIVEAMKMENEIKASVDGTVKMIHIAEGDLVDSENPMIELEPASE
jgi:acetyl/propionyl-CoA carboxylase alpha subunit